MKRKRISIIYSAYTYSAGHTTYTIAFSYLGFQTETRLHVYACSDVMRARSYVKLVSMA